MAARILHIIDHLGLGGAQTVVKGIFQQQAHNDNIFLFALRKREITINIYHKNVIYANTTAKYSFAPLKELHALILKHHINILHCHLFRSQIFGTILKALFFPNICLILHEQGMIMGSDTQNFLEDFCYRNFIRLTTQKVNRYIAASQAIRENLIRKAHVPIKKICLLQNFVDLQQFNPKARISIEIEREKNLLGIQHHDFVVGFAGRIVQRKGWREYLEAAKIVAQTVSNIKFLISGDGKEKQQLLSLIQVSKLQKSVLFLGYIENMLLFYSYLDCYVMPSYWEGLSLTQLEVMALGIPLITSDGPGMNEIPRRDVDALFCEVKNSEELAENIIKIYYDKELQDYLRQNSLNRVKTYSLENFLTKLNMLYAKCLRETELSFDND